MHLGIQFTHGGVAVQPFGFRALGAESYTGAVHVKGGGGDGETISFPEQQFSTESEASRHAESRARELIDSGELPR